MIENSTVNIEISEKEFKDLLNVNKINLKSANAQPYKVVEQLNLSKGEIAVSYKIIENVIFEEPVLFEGLEVAYGFGFVDCEFKKGIVFKNFQVTDYSKNNFDNNSIYFLRCRGINLILDSSTELHRGLLIRDSTFNKMILKGVNIGNGGTRIKNSEIENFLDLKSLNSQGLLISNSVINGRIRMETVSSDISFIKSEFSNNIDMWNVTTPFSFISNDSKYIAKVKFTACNIKSISLHNDNFQRELKFETRDSHNNKSGYLNELYVADSNFSEGFNIISTHKSTINKVTLPITASSKGIIIIEGFHIEETKISGFSEFFKMVFNNIIFKNLNVLDFSNSGFLNFSNCKGDSESSLFLLNSDLGPARFNNFSFKSFNNIQIKNSNLKEISTTNIEWFDQNQLNVTEEGFKNPQELREVYRQLKQSLRQDGNIIDSLTFQALEMKAYRKELLSSKNYSFGDRSIMIASWANDFGLDWIRTAVIIILMNLLFYLLLISSLYPYFQLNIYSPWFLNRSLNILWVKKEIFFQLFNPVRKISLMYPSAISDWVYLLDISQRVLLAVLIFQMVRAFRKFVLK